ncbi:MAG: DUF2812 domain-containing protein [Clostridia bacterium]|nr:DUF2812 domain-containing protein [Clostridia bacterium]
MRKIVRKLIPVWKVHEEEAWLNSMADAGWKLCHVSFCKYEFESCEKGAYRIRVELLEKNFDQPETADYLAFMEETGAQVTARWMRWAYFARPAELGEFELYSDRASRLKYMKRLMQFVGTVTAANLYIGLYNMWLLFGMGSGVNVLGFLNLLIGVFGAVGLWKMYKGYKALQAEGELFE